MARKSIFQEALPQPQCPGTAQSTVRAPSDGGWGGAGVSGQGLSTTQSSTFTTLSTKARGTISAAAGRERENRKKGNSLLLFLCYNLGLNREAMPPPRGACFKQQSAQIWLWLGGSANIRRDAGEGPGLSRPWTSDVCGSGLRQGRSRAPGPQEREPVENWSSRITPPPGSHFQASPLSALCPALAARPGCASPGPRIPIGDSAHWLHWSAFQ